MLMLMDIGGASVVAGGASVVPFPGGLLLLPLVPLLTLSLVPLVALPLVTLVALPLVPLLTLGFPSELVEL